MSTDTDDLRMVLAEVGGALSEDDIEAAESRTLKLLSDIRRRKNGGGSE